MKRNCRSAKRDYEYSLVFKKISRKTEILSLSSCSELRYTQFDGMIACYVPFFCPLNSINAFINLRTTSVLCVSPISMTSQHFNSNNSSAFRLFKANPIRNKDAWFNSLRWLNTSKSPALSPNKIAAVPSWLSELGWLEGSASILEYSTCSLRSVRTTQICLQSL